MSETEDEKAARIAAENAERLKKKKAVAELFAANDIDPGNASADAVLIAAAILTAAGR